MRYLLVLFLFLTGCAGSHEYVPTFDELWPVRKEIGSITLRYSFDVNSKERALLEESARVHSDAFIADNGPIRPVTVFLFRGTLVPGSTASKVIGTHYSDNGPILAAMGSMFEIPALYHELCHHKIGDADHENSLWGKWDSRERFIDVQLRTKREHLNWHDIYWTIDE